MLVDWENAIDLTSQDVSSQLTNRVVSFLAMYRLYHQLLIHVLLKGTPKFIAMSIALGKPRALDWPPEVRKSLPKMKPATKEWYVKTYGQERYDRYWGAMENLDEYRTYDPEKYHYSRRAFHDAESFAWVIVYELIMAWPEGFEEELTASAYAVINVFKEHCIDGILDSRMPYFSVHESGWKNMLHPRLAFLAPLVYKPVKYFSVEWLLWPELPEDHGHEAVKVLLREAILDMNEENDPIPLKQELRKPENYIKAQWALYNPVTPEIESTCKRGRSSEHGESTSKKAKVAGNDKCD